MVEELDKGGEAVGETGGQQTPNGVQAPGGSNEATQPVSGSEIVVGNQRFTDAQALAKAYGELQKGHTQANQRYSEQVKAYESIRTALAEIAKDPERKAKFEELLRKKEAAQVQPQREDSELRRRLDETEARLEYNEFKSAHSDMKNEELAEVIQYVMDQDKNGINLSLEQGYKLVMFDKHAGKLVSDTQRKTEESITKGKQASALGANPASSSAAPAKKANFFQMKSETEKNQHVLDLMKSMGIKHDD